jgi:hypothetical protein
MDFLDLIQQLNAELADGPRTGEPWESRATVLVRARLHEPELFLEWAKRNHHWSFTMAEVMASNDGGGHRPRELAYRLLVAILGRLVDEETVAAPTP